MPETTYDITNCDSEPIHIPGAIQPHGLLFGLTPDTLTLTHVSDNTASLLGFAPEDALGRTIDEILGGEAGNLLRRAVSLDTIADANPLRFSLTTPSGETGFDGILHRSGTTVVLELEPVSGEMQTVSFLGLYHSVKRSIGLIRECAGVVEVAGRAAEEVRALTGFDRVMIYQFDEEWNGCVIAEARREGVDPYLGLHFPASDIPRQARELYTRNWLRLISNASYVPASILQSPAVGDAPLDLSFSSLRSVSPIHREYLRNMGVAASMSISILRDRQLWGLIACHHETPRYVSYETRSACEMLGQVLSSQIDLREKSEQIRYVLDRQNVANDLIARIGEGTSWIETLQQNPENLLNLAGAQGVAVSLQNRLITLGQAPSHSQIGPLLEWLRQEPGRSTFSTHALPSVYPPAEAFQEVGSGILAITVSREQRGQIVWFRPEVVETVSWAGEPKKAVETAAGALTLHPRKSFASWKETVRQRSRKWDRSELAAATELKNALTASSLRRAVDELEQSNTELDAFAHAVSHDLRAPLRALSHVADWIGEDLSPDEAGKIRGHLDKMKQRVTQMDTLVAGLLQYARVGKDNVDIEQVDVRELVDSAVALLEPPASFQIVISPDVPVISTNRVRLQQVFLNLIGNAIKYHDRPDGTIWVSSLEPGSQAGNGMVEFTVADDGPGIAKEYHDRIFGLFQTLGVLDRAESTGIGLALVKRIVESEGGYVDVRSEPGAGASFVFTWPKSPLTTA